jgi:hypothetical protein
MRRLVTLALLSTLLASPVLAQVPGQSSPMVPIGGAGGGGGSGTVTSVSAGNLSPLFTTSVVNPTSTPALSFALSSVSANAVLAGPTSGGAVAPTYRALVISDLPTGIPNANLANPATTVNGQTCTLGSTCTVTGAPSGSAGGDLAGTYPNPTLSWISRGASQTLNIGAGGTLGAAAFVAPGTGVATALGVNVGSAGAFVVNGGALGTPSSGVATNLTGLPISTGLTGAGTGVLTALGVNVGSAGAFVTFNGAGGTPSSMVGTNITGTAAGLTAGNVTTNANLTGVITSVGNATSIASQTGTGSKFVVDTSPTLVTPVLGVATGTSLALGGATIGSDALGVTGTTTHNGAVSVVGASFGLSGNISVPAWTTAGVRYKNVAATLTDTTSSGTVAAARTDNFGGNTIAASNAVTYTSYYSAYFSNPTAGTNVTFTNKSAIGADSISINGQAQSTFALAVNGTSNLNGGVSIGAGSAITSSGAGGALGSNAFTSTAYAPLASPTFTGTVTLPDSSTFATNFTVGGNAILTAPGAANLQFGAANVNGSPVAQKLSFQGALAGSATNQASANTTIVGSLGTGTGTNGDIIFQTGVKGSTGTAQATATTALTIKGETKNVVVAGQIVGTQGTNSAPTFSEAGGLSTGINIRSGSALDFYIGSSVIGTLNSNGLDMTNSSYLAWSSGSSTATGPDTFLTRAAAASIQHGAADAAAPVAQTIKFQSVVAGTSNTAGVNATIIGSLSTGSGASGDIILKTGGTGAGATAQNAATTALTIKGATQEAIFSAPARWQGYTVSTLPAGNTGDNAYVTDAVACTFLATLTGGGSTVCPVFYNGTAWVGA